MERAQVFSNLSHPYLHYLAPRGGLQVQRRSSSSSLLYKFQLALHPVSSSKTPGGSNSPRYL